MNIESIIRKAYHSIKNNPYLALPSVISWIPTASIGLIFALVFQDVAKNHTIKSVMILVESNPSAVFYSALNILMSYLSILVIAVLLSIVASYYTRATYPFISRAINSGKTASLSESLGNAKVRMYALLITDIVLILMIIGGVAAYLTVAAAISAVLGGAGAAICVFAGIFLFFLAIYYIVPIGIVIDNVAALEGKSGFSAIKSAYCSIKNRKNDAWFFTIVVGVIAGIYVYMLSIFESVLSYIIGPYATIITMALAIFSSAFVSICNTLFYFEVTAPPFLKKSIKE